MINRKNTLYIFLMINFIDFFVLLLQELAKLNSDKNKNQNIEEVGSISGVCEIINQVFRSNILVL
jgi:hypothetical protein